MRLLAASEIGYIGYFTNMKIIDLYGLVTPGVHPWLPQGLEFTTSRVIEHYSPTYVLIETGEAPIEAYGLDGRYSLAASFQEVVFSLCEEAGRQVNPVSRRAVRFLPNQSGPSGVAPGPLACARIGSEQPVSAGELPANCTPLRSRDLRRDPGKDIRDERPTAGSR